MNYKATSFAMLFIVLKSLEILHSGSKVGTGSARLWGGVRPLGSLGLWH